jgi:hypothetical protein
MIKADIEALIKRIIKRILKYNTAYNKIFSRTPYPVMIDENIESKIEKHLNLEKIKNKEDLLNRDYNIKLPPLPIQIPIFIQSEKV